MFNIILSKGSLTYQYFNLILLVILLAVSLFLESFLCVSCDFHSEQRQSTL